MEKLDKRAMKKLKDTCYFSVIIEKFI